MPNMKFEFFPGSKSEVRSDEGFEVLYTGRFELTYREAERRMSLHCEHERDSSGNHVLVVGTCGLQAWLPPFDKELISEAKRAEIQSRIAAAVEFMGSSNCEFVALPE